MKQNILLVISSFLMTVLLINDFLNELVIFPNFFSVVGLLVVMGCFALFVDMKNIRYIKIQFIFIFYILFVAVLFEFIGTPETAIFSVSKPVIWVVVVFYLTHAVILYRQYKRNEKE